jgi:phage/plasmid-like protein (TIGR03299 family)
MPANVEQMFSVRVAPWHGLGTVVEEAPDSIAAIKLAGMDWEVHQQDIYLSDGSQIPIHKANVRSDNGLVLGLVTERYKIVQNHDAFSFTDELVGGGDVRYETAGVLKEGRAVWMLARMNQEYSILGDKVDSFVCFHMAHDGTGAIRAHVTPVRVVCQNTLNLAIKQASRSWSARHTGDVAAKISEAQRTLGLVTEYMESLNEEANLLADIYVPDNKFIEVLNEVLPIDSKMNERAANTVMRRREAIQRAMRADDIAKFRGTGWQVMNAVSDYVGHTEPARRTGTFAENRFANVITGDTLFDKTYQILKAIA